jgi:uracil-DNA glycosylase
MKVSIHPEWSEWLKDEFEQPYFESLIDFVKKAYAHSECFPPGKLIFSAFDQCPPSQLKVVILGQDPYHGSGQANGLCFSVNPGVKMPPSLVNIFKELRNDLGKELPSHGDLSRWAEQGVLLLNATLTVEAGKAGSHQGRGWEVFTDAVIQRISQRCDALVFVLWGNFAQQKENIIDTDKHLVLKSAHPSPLSAHRGFWNNHQFSCANEWLQQKGKIPINW